MVVLPRHLVFAASVALFPVCATTLEAQDADPSIAVSPYAGIGPIIDHGSLVSWSAHVFVEIDLTRAPLRWSLFGSIRGIGAACADGCDLDGESLGLGVTYLFRSFGVGGGMGLFRQSSSWYAQPHAVLSTGHGAFRTQVRVEVPLGAYGVTFPILLGFRLPIG